MARRATSLTKGRAATPQTASTETSEQAVAKAPRRGKQSTMPAVEKSAADAFFPGGGEPTAIGDESVPAKVRRGRKPRLVELAAETLPTEDERPVELAAPAMDAGSSESAEMPDVPGKHIETQPTARATEPAAAQWDANTGTATFDWPAIEHVAMTPGPNQAMAKLLLAARAEGAKSRWPF